MAKQPADPVQLYQIKITLRDSRPPIWRRFLVKGDTSLAKLHEIVQTVMGWQGAHLHQFTIRGKRYGMPDEDESGRLLDEREYRLSQVSSGGRFEYVYDFGDNWEHLLEIETIGSPENRARYPVCLDGARACPPEDVGGISGYESFVEAMRDPQHPEHDNYSDWGGANFDSEVFSIARVNRLLSTLR